MARKGFYFDMALCMGCRTCQVACKDRNGLETGTIYRRVETYEVGAYPTATAYQLSRTCNHCENPECVRVCPVGAMHVDEEDGTVQHDDETCIGCESCVKACPYGVPQYRPDFEISGKCDACLPLRQAGEENACVAACPLRAIEFGDIEELRARHPEAVDAIAVLPDPSQTAPSVAIGAKPAALEAGFTQIVI